MNYHLKFIVFCFLLSNVLSSCTDLEEQIYSEILAENFYQTEEEIISAMAPAYGDLRALLDLRGTHTMGTYGTDEIVLPTRGRHWYDGGNFQRFHEHTWTAENPYLANGWTQQFQLVNRANMLLYQFENLENMNSELKANFNAELKCIRALGYFYLCDNFGNVPIVDRFDVPDEFSISNNLNFQEGRKEVFNFIENDILSSIDDLSEAVDNSTYGRFNKWAAYALLVKLYSNSEVWTGVNKWEEVIKYSDLILKSENYSLAEDYFTIFSMNNENSEETIFAIPFDEFQTGEGWGSYNTTVWYLVGQHHEGQKIFGVTHAATSGSCAIPSHYKAFHSDDIRRKGWMVGPQYNINTGEPLLCTEESAPNPLVYTVDFDDIYNPGSTIVFDHKNALEYQGARFAKYEISYQGNGMSNDYSLFRLADILLLKAEAIIRLNGGAVNQTAVDIVNLVKSRAFDANNFTPYTLETLTLDQLLQERSFELYYEGTRRRDLIRWNKYVRGEWEFFDRSEEGDYRNVYPIPQSQLNVNPDLNQNPGY